MSQQTKQYFDSHAVSFDSIYLGESRLARWFNTRFRKAVYERFRIALEASGDVRGKTVLDIGCGSGRYAVDYAKRGAKRVVGIDLSPKMLSLARAHAKREKVQDRCEFLQGDFLAREFAEPFDIVLAMGVFDYVGDPEIFLRAMVRRSRGTVIASFPGRNLLRMRLRRLRYRMQSCPVFFYSEEELRAVVAVAGMHDAEFIYMPHSGTGYVVVGHAGS